MIISKNNKTALIIGATGLIGQHLVRALLQHPGYTQVVTFGRTPLDTSHEKLVQHKVDFNQLDQYRHLFKGNDLFCCLGTTMAKAGSKEAFYKVDFTYTFNAAKLAVVNGVGQILLVSSVGADSDSIFYYSRVKGEIEEAIKKLPFWATHIFQPSLLLGERNENRWGEEIAQKIGRPLNRLFGGLLQKYRPIEAEYVAKAMINAAQGVDAGVHVYPSDDLQEMAEQEERGLRST